MKTLAKFALILPVVWSLASCGGPEVVTPPPEPENWWDNPGMFRDKFAAVGISQVIAGNISTARIQAEANARGSLAASMKAKITSLAELWTKQAGDQMMPDSVSSLINNEVFTRQFVNTTLTGSRAMKYKQIGSNYYALLILEPNKVGQFYKDMTEELKKAMLRDATLAKTEYLKEQTIKKVEELQAKEEEMTKKLMEGIAGGTVKAGTQ